MNRGDIYSNNASVGGIVSSLGVALDESNEQYDKYQYIRDFMIFDKAGGIANAEHSIRKVNGEALTQASIKQTTAYNKRKSP